MLQRILVILENEEVHPQAVHYARELAQRMDAEVTFLMLVEMAHLEHQQLGSVRSAIRELDRRTGELLASFSADFLQRGVSASVALRVGDPPQELLKFLAERPPFQVIIWGSSEDLPAGGRRGHWLAQVTPGLECPLWTVKCRRKRK